MRYRLNKTKKLTILFLLHDRRAKLLVLPLQVTLATSSANVRGLGGYHTIGLRVVQGVINLGLLADLASSHTSSTWLLIVTFGLGCRTGLAYLRYTCSDPEGCVGSVMVICRMMSLGLSSKNIAKKKN